jgi:hypothetical protein
MVMGVSRNVQAVWLLRWTPPHNKHVCPIGNSVKRDAGSTSVISLMRLAIGGFPICDFQIDRGDRLDCLITISI